MCYGGYGVMVVCFQTDTGRENVSTLCIKERVPNKSPSLNSQFFFVEMWPCNYILLHSHTVLPVLRYWLSSLITVTKIVSVCNIIMVMDRYKCKLTLYRSSGLGTRCGGVENWF